MDLYSVVCVRDRAASQKWFEVFFGRAADHVIGEEYLWQVGENASPSCRSGPPTSRAPRRENDWQSECTEPTCC